MRMGYCDAETHDQKTIHPAQAFHIMSCNFIQVLALDPMSRNQPSPANQRPPVQTDLVKEQESGPGLEAVKLWLLKKRTCPFLL